VSPSAFRTDGGFNRSAAAAAAAATNALLAASPRCCQVDDGAAASVRRSATDTEITGVTDRANGLWT